MSLHAAIFYLLGALILGSAGLAVTRRNPVHAVVYLIFSFVGSAMLFFLLGAPFLAALEVIIYAGAVMILFLFVVMMLKAESADQASLSLRRWIPPLVVGLLFVALAALTAMREPGGAEVLKSATVAPRVFGRYVFERYWLAVEIISVLLLLGLLAAVQLGIKGTPKGNGTETKTGAES